MAGLGLTQAANNFVNAYTMRNQMQSQRAEQQKQAQVNNLLGSMLMGGAQPEQMQELAQTAPDKFLAGQNYLAQQEAQKAKAQQKSSFSDIAARFAQDPTNKDLGLQMILIDPNTAKQVQGLMGVTGDQSGKILNKAYALKTMFEDSPEKAVQYYSDNLANDQAFIGMREEMAAGDFEGAAKELEMAVASFGQDAHGKMYGQPQSFEGTSMSAQMGNILLDATKAGTPEFDLAKSWWTAPEIVNRPDGSSVIVNKTLPDSIIKDNPVVAKALMSEADTKANEMSNDTGLKITGLTDAPKKISVEQKSYDKDFLSFKNMNDTLVEYNRVLEEMGPQMSIGPLNAEKSQTLKSAYSNAMLAVKEAAELGALSGPDMGIVEQNMPDPSTFGGLIKGKGAATQGVKSALSLVARKASNLNDVYKDYEIDLKDIEAQASPISADAIQLYKNPPPGYTKDKINEMFKAQFGRLPTPEELK